MAETDPRIRWKAALRLGENLWEGLVRLVYPLPCPLCGALLPGDDHMGFCSSCTALLPTIDGAVCPGCGLPGTGRASDDANEPLCESCRSAPPSPLSRTRAAVFHLGAGRRLAHRLKYERQPWVGECMARTMARHTAFLPPEIDGICPVPLSPTRRKERGYNQAEILARCLAKELHRSLETDLLHRPKDTRPQVGLSASERRENMEGAFQALGRANGRSLLIVDDVYTTGATLRACANSLLLAGATSVYAYTWARGVPYADPSVSS